MTGYGARAKTMLATPPVPGWWTSSAVAQEQTRSLGTESESMFPTGRWTGHPDRLGSHDFRTVGRAATCWGANTYTATPDHDVQRLP